MMRKIGRKHECFSPNCFRNIGERSLLKLERDKTLTAKISARPFLQMRQLESIVLGMLIHPLQPIRNPTTACLHKANAQAGMARQNSAKNQARRRGHLFHRMRVQMEEGVTVKAFRTGGGQPNTRADVDQRRPAAD